MPGAIGNYISVAKPGIIAGNVIAAAGGFLLASRGRIDIARLLWTLGGMALVVASGCVLNNCIDRIIDRKMTRTCNRVLARGLMTPKAAVSYALLLGVAGTAILWSMANELAAAIVLTGFAIYVVVYTLYLKRKSVHATLIGSLTGAAPPLAGYCAVRNEFDTGAVILLAIFGLWQVPHSYAIAIFRFNDYAAAAIPVLPVKRGTPAAKKRIVGYILAFTMASLMLTCVGYTGYGYLAATAVLGLCWLYLALRGYKTTDDRLWARRQFVFSILAIFVLSLMMSIDFAVSAPSHLPDAVSLFKAVIPEWS